MLRWQWSAVHFKIETLLSGFAYPLATMPTVLWETLRCCITLHCVVRLGLIMFWPSMFVFGSAILHANNPLKDVSSEFVLVCKKAAPLHFIQATPQLVLPALISNFAYKVACFRRIVFASQKETLNLGQWENMTLQRFQGGLKSTLTRSQSRIALTKDWKSRLK